MRYALIGCGRISPNHIAAARSNGLEIVGVCDIDPQMCHERVVQFELETVHQYSDYKEMIDKEKPELVAIATESGAHAAIALECISRNIHLVIDT